MKKPVVYLAPKRDGLGVAKFVAEEMGVDVHILGAKTVVASVKRRTQTLDAIERRIAVDYDAPGMKRKYQARCAADSRPHFDLARNAARNARAVLQAGDIEKADALILEARFHLRGALDALHRPYLDAIANKTSKLGRKPDEDLKEILRKQIGSGEPFLWKDFELSYSVSHSKLGRLLREVRSETVPK